MNIGQEEHVIIQEAPGMTWKESSLLGNGRLGAAVYGGIEDEWIDLSEITFFSGQAGKEADCPKEGAKAFQKMRRALAKEDYKKSVQEAGGFVGKKNNYGTNLKVGRVRIRFDQEPMANPSYRRILNLDEGLLHIEIGQGQEKISREAFVSHADPGFYYHVVSNRKQSIRISFENPSLKFRVHFDENGYKIGIKALEKKHSDGLCGVSLEAVFEIRDCDGNVSIDRDGIQLENAGTWTLVCRMYTDFDPLLARCDPKVLVASKKSRQEENLSYEKILNRHIMDISKYMGRQVLSLKGHDDKSELLFYMGRYLLLSSSREDSPLPAHLQGVWNDDVASNLGWTCDMHLDINTQMNYWLSEAGNLVESQTPLFGWIENILIPSGRKSARLCYGYSGWSADLVSNAWGYSAPYWDTSLSPCPTGGIWLCDQLWQHFLYSQDMEFLKEHVRWVYEEAAVFFSEYVYEKKDGSFACGPSVSPENGFIIDDHEYYFSENSTYEVLMIREFFRIYIQIMDLLGIENGLTRKSQRILEKLPSYKIKDDGTIAEYTHDYRLKDLWHRHTSHLLGLFPYKQISPETTPELAKAAYETIRQKLTPYENWEDTGWARNMLMLYMARLGKGNEALWHMKEMQKALLSRGGLVMHPPTRGTYTSQEVYELDGNTGFSMCVLEMLLQSREGILYLLPALPDLWSEGYIKGLRAEGRLVIDIKWEKKTLKEIRMESDVNQELILNYCGIQRKIYIEKNKSIPLAFHENDFQACSLR